MKEARVNVAQHNSPAANPNQPVRTSDRLFFSPSSGNNYPTILAMLTCKGTKSQCNFEQQSTYFYQQQQQQQQQQGASIHENKASTRGLFSR